MIIPIGYLLMHGIAADFKQKFKKLTPG